MLATGQPISNWKEKRTNFPGWIKDRCEGISLAAIGNETCLVKPFRWEDIAARIDAAFNPPREESKRTTGSGVEGNLREVSLVAAEDTRRTGQLLRHFEITKPLISY